MTKGTASDKLKTRKEYWNKNNESNKERNTTIDKILIFLQEYETNEDNTSKDVVKR